MSSLSAIQPQQRRCSAQRCGRRSTIRTGDLFQITIRNRQGGTHVDAAWICPICKADNVIPASHLPRGLVAQLQKSRPQPLPAPAPAPLPAPVPAPVQVAVPPPNPASGPRREIRPAETARIPAVTAPEPIVADVATPAAPKWITGPAARKMLIEAVEDAFDDEDGDVVPLVWDGGMLVPQLTRDNHGDPLPHYETSRILETLDRIDCVSMVVTGLYQDGTRWQVMFHPQIGAATLV